MAFLIEQFSQALFYLYSLTGGSVGWALILFTILIRTILLPVTLPSIKAQKKITDLKPELDKLKTKFKDDKTGFQQAQLELYKKYNINPLAGCLPQLAQLGVLIILYQTLLHFFANPTFHGVTLNFNFFGLPLNTPDQTYVLPVLAGLTQLILSVMIMPVTETPDKVVNTSKQKKTQEENKKEEDMAEMAATMQQQMMYLMPVMTVFFAIKFSAGLSLYWVVTTIYSVVQQYFISGWGGLSVYTRRITLWLKTR